MEDDLAKVEYRVRPVLRFIITRYEQRADGACGVDTKGEYDGERVADEVAYALCRAEHERLGFPPGDERIQYPRTAESRGWGYEIGSSGRGYPKQQPLHDWRIA